MNSTSVSAKTDTLRVNTQSDTALIAHLPGVIALNLQHPTVYPLRSWGRTMALFKEETQDMYLSDDFHTESNAKKHLKFIRKNTRYLMDLFNEKKDMLEHISGDYKIRISLSGNVYNMVSAEVRSEVYVPVAVFHRNKLRGGAYAYIWRCCTAEQAKDSQTRPLASAPVTAIVTGMCMFGTNIMGVDKNGQKHPLTNTFYTLPDGACIERIELAREGLHPYERMMLREFELQLPMIKALGNGLSQKVFYQCVHAEYILYGINAYIRGEMTLRALHVYTRYVSERANLIREAIEKSCEKHGVEFDGGQSTLSCLFENLRADKVSSHENWYFHFLSMHGIQADEISSNISTEKRLIILKNVFSNCIDKLASQNGVHGEVWSHIKKMILSHNVEGNQRMDTSSLLTLNFLNYAAKVAIVKGSHPSKNLCLLHPIQEKAMALAYKDLHAEKFGEILAINWVPPIFSHGSFKDGLYYLEKHKDTINHLIHEGVLEFCALETGAHAIGDTIAAQLAKNHVLDLLGEVGKYVPAASPKQEIPLSNEQNHHRKDVSADRTSPVF